MNRAHELPDYTPSGIAKAVLSECDRLGDPPSMTSCSCGGIDAVPHATDHTPDCTIWDTA